MVKMATLDVKLQGKGATITLSRYDFNHALECMGITPSAWGNMPAEKFRFRLAEAQRHLFYSPQEFTRSESTVRVGKEPVTFAALDAEKVYSILKKLVVFGERVGDGDIHY